MGIYTHGITELVLPGASRPREPRIADSARHVRQSDALARYALENQLGVWIV